MKMLALAALALVLAFVAYSAVIASTGKDPYSSFSVGDDETVVLDRADKAWGKPASSSGSAADRICFQYGDSHFTKLCFVDGQLFSKSR